MAHSDLVGEAHEIDIKRRRGATKTFRIRLLQAGTTTPLDVTGYTAELNIHTIKDVVDNTTLVFRAPGAPTGTPTDGILEFDFALFDSVAIGKYFYGIRVIQADTLDDVPVLGKFEVEQDRSPDP
jgi:hypothetical protein